jgi:carbon monoxide dehydrogenase subunit G
MIKTIILTAVGLLVLAVGTVLVYAATKPDTFRVQRSTSVKAPPEKIFALINDFRHWASWSPYEHKDPAMKRTYSGSESGKGAVYEWDGDKNVGKGRIEITDTSPPNKVTIKLTMIKPFEAHNIVEFTIEPKGEFTTVTWAMNGQVPYLAKVVHVFFNVDRMVGNDFEAGLFKLKATAEIANLRAIAEGGKVL